MRILITGAAGFIGSNLAQALLDRNHHVIGLDNLSHGHRENIQAFMNDSRFAFVEGDIRDRDTLSEVASGCQTIVHLAAQKIPRYEDAYETLVVNSEGTHNVVKIAVENNAKLVAASTSDVYGKNPSIPFEEHDDLVVGAPDVKRWSYAISKMFNEQLLLAAHQRFQINVVLLRFFGGYGPHQNLTWWGGPQSVFINHALEDKEIPLHGDGQQTRTFTYVSDHVDGVVRAIEKAAANNQVFNIGSTQEITIENLAKFIWRLVRGDSPPKIKLIPYETFGKYEDVRRRVPNIDKARRLLGFAPKVDLETGLRMTIEWQIKHRDMLASDNEPLNDDHA